MASKLNLLQPVLNNIIERARAAKATGAPFKAIFDLDSTIFDISPRITKIFHAFAALPEIKKNFKKEATVLSQIRPDPSDFGVKRTLARNGLSAEDTTPEFIQLLVTYWRKNFFSDTYLDEDIPYPGVQKFILQLQNTGAQILYLTGRDIPRMLQGTVASLKKYGFPVQNDMSNLFLKPSAEIRDHDFKKKFFEEMEKTSEEIWFFENEPTNIYLVLKISPHVNIVFVDTVHSGAMPPPTEDIHRISSFDFEVG